MNRHAAPIRGSTAALYAAGDIGTAVTSVCLAFYWLYFLIVVAGLPPWAAGLIHGSGYAVSALANLGAGALLDHRFPDPRKRCGLVAGLGVGLAVAFAAMWMLPPAPWRPFWYLATSWIFHLTFAPAYLAYLSLSARLGRTDAERLDLNSWRFGGTMLATLVVLALHRATEGRLELSVRLQLLGAAVAVLGALGAIICGFGLRTRVAADEPLQSAPPSNWRAVFATPDLKSAMAVNLVVWFMVQSALVLTVFLCRAAAVSDAMVLLVLQVSTIIAAALTSAAARRLSPQRLIAGAALTWIGGAVLWQAGWAPLPATVALGLGLGAGTVLSWAGVAGVLARQSGLEGRAYAGLSLTRDLVAASVPLLAAALMTGRTVGSAPSGLAAGAGLLGAALASGAAMWALRPRRPPSADGGRAAVPR